MVVTQRSHMLKFLYGKFCIYIPLEFLSLHVKLVQEKVIVETRFARGNRLS